MKRNKRVWRGIATFLVFVLVMVCMPKMNVTAANTYSKTDMFKYSGIKGVQNATNSTEFGGLEHSLVNVFLDDAIKSPDSLWAKNGWIAPYVFEGETYYFGTPPGMGRVETANRNNMSISVVFLLRKTVDQYGSDSSFLIDAGSRVNGYNYYAPNSDLTTYGGRAMRAYWHYLMEWLIAEGLHIDNFILGNEVNMPNHWHYSGSLDPATVATKYANSFELMWQGVRAYTDVSRCSVSIDHSWQHNDEGRGITAKNFLHHFYNRLLAINGYDIDWYISAHLYPAILYDTEIWVDRYGLSPNNTGARFVDGSNLWVMTNYVRDTFGEKHRIMLTEQGFTNQYGANAQAACLALTYYAALYDPMVDCFILHNVNEGNVNTNEGVKSLNFDINGTLAGQIYTKIGNGNEADQKWIADVCLPIIGVSSWSQVVPNFGVISKPKEVLVSGITLSQSSLNMKVSNTHTLQATVAPADATNQELQWSSSNSSVVSVNNGVLTANWPGTATITASAADGSGVFATCTVTVERPVSNIYLSNTSLSLKLGASHTLQATVEPWDASNQVLSWSSSDASVVSVNNGVLTANKPGIATITASATDGSGIFATCAVTVEQPVTGIALNQTNLVLKTQDTYTLQATVSPTNAVNQVLSWSSSDASVVSVNNGILTANWPGTATITASATDGSGVFATCTVTVVQDVTGISLNWTSLDLELGATDRLTATVLPENASNKNYVWSTSNEDVVTIDAYGEVKAVRVGTATITAAATDGSGVSATCTVTVMEDTDNPFADVPKSHWGYAFMKYNLEKGYMSGSGKDEFENVIFMPDAYCMREQFVQILYSIEGKPVVAVDNPFADIEDGQWYTNAVLWAYNDGIVSGVKDTPEEKLFGYNLTIDREQLALMMYKYALKVGKCCDINQNAFDAFADAEKVNSWASDGVKWAISNGLMSGKPGINGEINIDPQGKATRAECATMIMRLVEME